MSKVSIIIVTHNSEKEIGNCLESLQQQSYQDFEVIIVDTNSKDKTAQIANRYTVNYIQLSNNVGFSRGCNIGALKSTGFYIALLNPDTQVHKDWLLNLVNVIDTKINCGIVTSKIYLGNSEYLDSAGSCYNQILHAWSRGVYEKDEGQYNEIQEVPMATACSMLFKKEILEKTYLFDDHFFLYMEELDFCLRVRNLGYEILYTPHSLVYHAQSQSVRKKSKHVELFKQYHGNINRAKLLGQYLSYQELLFNIHLILMSFVYWYWMFLKSGKVWMLAKLILHETLFFWRGLQNKKNISGNKKWKDHIKHMKLSDMMQLKKDLEIKKIQYLSSLKNYV